MPICKTCSDIPVAEGPSTCSSCGRSSANRRFIAWDSDTDPTWARFGGVRFAAEQRADEIEMGKSLPWLITRLALGGMAFSALLLLGAYAARAHERPCATWAYTQVCNNDWPPYQTCRWRRSYCKRWASDYAIRDERPPVRHYRDTEYDPERGWNRRDPRDERGIHCLTHVPPIRAVGPANLSEKGAMNGAIRTWEGMASYDWGQKYQNIESASGYRWRCDVVSTNESIIGKTGEAVFGDGAKQKRCVVIGTPCMQPMQRGDKDSKD